MRQAGLKPKSHRSGTYWIRANAGSGKSKRKAAPKKRKEVEAEEITDPNILYDSDGDGKADFIGWLRNGPPLECPTWLIYAFIFGFFAWAWWTYG